MTQKCPPSDESLTKELAGPRLRWWHVTGALVLVALGHAAGLSGFFLSDDFFNILNALDGKDSFWRLMQGFSIDSRFFHDGWMPAPLPHLKYFRPLFLLSLLLDHAIWGVDAWGYHLTNIVLHVLVTFLLFLVFRELVPGRKIAALVGALLFAWMPYHAMTVGWVSGRTELLSAVGMVLSMWSFLRFAQCRRLPFYLLSLTAGVSALFCKENAVILPLMLAALWAWGPCRHRPSLWWLSPYAFALIPYLVLRGVALEGLRLPDPSPYYHAWSEPGFLSWAVAKSVCVFYDLLLQFPLLFPVELYLQRSPLLLAFLAAVALLIIYGMVRLIRGNEDDSWRKTALIAVLWAILPMLPTAPLLVAPFYFYFSFMGIALLYVVLWQRWSESARIGWLGGPRLRKAVVWGVLLVFGFTLQMATWLSVYRSHKGRALLAQIGSYWPSGCDMPEFYLIDVPPSIGPSKAALRLLWPERSCKLYYLTVNPVTKRIGTHDSSVRQLDPYTLETVALGVPYFSGFYGLLALGLDRRSLIREGPIQADGFEVTLKEIEASGPYHLLSVRRILFRFNKPLAAPCRVFLRCQGGRRSVSFTRFEPLGWLPP